MMRKLFSILVALASLLFIFSCSQNSTMEESETSLASEVDGLDIHVIACLEKYIRKSINLSIEPTEENTFYWIHFINRDTVNYFTICSFTSYPYYVDTNQYCFLGYELTDQNIILIIDKKNPCNR